MQNRINRILVCTLIIFASSQLWAQSEDKPSKYFPNVIPPVPNSASLGQYGLVPLNQFTGNQNISIPLAEIKSGTLTLPVSASYSSDGVKVDQYESNIGMGWSLNAGGVITRQVFDVQDNTNGRMQKPNTAANSAEMYNFLTNAASGPLVDTQSDIFSYNVNGMSGKFFLDENNLPVEIEPSGLKIGVDLKVLEMGFAPNDIPEITITDTKGIIYYFGGTNAIESSSTRRIFTGDANPNPLSPDMKTAWYLTKIVDPASNSVITLSYDSRSIVYVSGNDQNLDYEVNAGITLTYRLSNYQTKSYCTESILKEINSSTGKITFVTSKRFTDPDFPLSKIDEINYFNDKGALIKKTSFTYDQYTSTTFLNSYNTTPDYLRKRLFLKKITEFSTNLNPAVHEFEYYFPERLPVRFCFAQDNYGVFNGKTNSSLISDENQVPYSVANLCFSDHKLANRRPDSNFGYYGLLKKVKYPTKGTAEMQYEAHVLGKESIANDVPKSSFGLFVTTDSETMSNTNTLNIHSSVAQTITIQGVVKNDCPGDNPFPLRANIQIAENATGNPLISFTDRTNGDFPTNIGTTYTLLGNAPYANVTFNLEANKDYIVSIALIRSCMYANIYFDYYSNPVTFQLIDKQIGGLRTSKVIKESLNGIQEVENYFYGPKSCITCQSGQYISKAPVSYKRVIDRSNLCESPNKRTLTAIGSSNLSRVYSSQNAQFGYEYVTKSYGTDFENGGEESRYEIVQDGTPVTTQGEIFDQTTPMTNGFGSGRLLEQRILKKNSANELITLKETFNQYLHDTAKDKTIKAYNVYMSFQGFIYMRDSGGCSAINQWSSYTVSEYSLRSQWSYLNQSIEKTYDSNGLNSLTVTKTYNYGNTSHLQLTSETSSVTGNEIVKTNYIYPHDAVSEPFMQALIDANRLKPIGTEVYRGTSGSLSLISKDKTLYGNDSSTGNLLAPKSVYAAKFPNALPTITNIGNLEKKITFDQYDSNGNILQYTPESGIPVTIIWGYKKSMPIAKLENAAYSQVTSYIPNLQTKSDSGTETELLSALAALRTALPNAMITTYTYQPLIGLSTVTDPKGEITTYVYDSYNRLWIVKDKNGNILSENQYHYQTN